MAVGKGRRPILERCKSDPESYGNNFQFLLGLAAFITSDSLANTVPIEFGYLAEHAPEVGPIKIKSVTGTEPGVQLPAQTSAALFTSLKLLPRSTFFVTHGSFL